VWEGKGQWSGCVGGGGALSWVCGSGRGSVPADWMTEWILSHIWGRWTVSLQCELAGVSTGWMTEWILSHTQSRWTASPQCDCVGEFPVQMGNGILPHRLHISTASLQCDCTCGLWGQMIDWRLVHTHTHNTCTASPHYERGFFLPCSISNNDACSQFWTQSGENVLKANRKNYPKLYWISARGGGRGVGRGFTASEEQARKRCSIEIRIVWSEY